MVGREYAHGSWERKERHEKRYFRVAKRNENEPWKRKNGKVKRRNQELLGNGSIYI